MPVPAQLIAYHYVMDGELLLKIEDREPLSAGSSDMIVLPRNDLAAGPIYFPPTRMTSSSRRARKGWPASAMAVAALGRELCALFRQQRSEPPSDPEPSSGPETNLGRESNRIMD